MSDRPDGQPISGKFLLKYLLKFSIRSKTFKKGLDE